MNFKGFTHVLKNKKRKKSIHLSIIYNEILENALRKTQFREANALVKLDINN